MNLLKTIIERLNQRVEVANIFDQIYPLCELNANGNEKAWVHYIGNGQAEVVTNFDAKQGTLFWAKRGKVAVNKTESLKVSGCKTLYQTTFPLTAYAVVRKSHLPCDSEDSQDWIASRIYKLISGTDPDFKVAIGVIQYEVIPNGYVNEIKSLTANYEWSCVAVDVDVAVVSSSEDGCYDVCATGDIPLPDFQPCTPCLTEVAVDGVTIIGNGTTADPLVAIGGGGGGGVMTAIAFSADHLSITGNQYVVGNVVWYNGNIYRCIANNDSILPTNATYWTNLGAGFQTIERPIDWDATSGNNQILNKPTIPILPSSIVEDVTATAPMSSSGGVTPDISITQADGTTDGYLSSTDWNTFDGKFNVPNGLSTDYLDGLGSPQPFPTIPNAQVNSDWNATSGVEEILNKPTIPAAQIQSDWNQSNNVALDYIKNKPTIPQGGLPSGGTAGQILTKVDATDYNATWQENYADWTSVVKHIVKNDGTGLITKGTAVYVTGSNGTNMLVGKASNTSESTSSKTMGLMQSDITTTGGTQTGFVITEGLLGNLNTAGTTAGDPVWLGVNGALIYGLINKPYAPAHLVFIGIVTKVSAGNGEIFVKVQNGFELKEIHDVDLITTTPINGHILGYNGTLWVNKTIATWLGFTPVTDARTITINGTTQDLSADRSWTISSAASYKSTTDGIATSTNNITLSHSQLIPANTFAVGNIIRIHNRMRAIGVGAAKTQRIYVNSINDLTGALLVATYSSGSNVTTQGMKRDLVIKSIINTEVFASAVAIATDDSSSNTFTNLIIDWTTDKYIIFSNQRGSAADTLVSSSYLIEKL